MADCSNYYVTIYNKRKSTWKIEKEKEKEREKREL